MSNKAPGDAFFKIGGGTMAPDARSYVKRQTDDDLLQNVLAGKYCNVLTARQMGKSSLMVQTANSLKRENIQTVVIDLDSVGTHNITDLQWYLGILRLIRQQIELDVNEMSWWGDQRRSTPVQRFTRFVREELLAKVDGRVVVFVDEIDSTLRLKFTDDFFLAIRAMYNERASSPEYRRLTFVLVGVARPADLIKSRHKTPYNIGQTVELDDFTRVEAMTLLPGLAERYPDRAEGILDRVLYWTAGHPYLTQQLCGNVVIRDKREWSDEQIDDLVDDLFFQEGRIREEDHLQWVNRYVRSSLHRDSMLRTYQEVLFGQDVQDEERSIEKSQLKLSGLVKADDRGNLQVRNRIYKRVFDNEWVDLHLPSLAGSDPELSGQSTKWFRRACSTVKSWFIWKEQNRSDITGNGHSRSRSVDRGREQNTQ